MRVENLVKRFPIQGSDDVVSAVSDVSFAIGRGETLGLVGESGSGKTTVGRCLLKLTPPTAGGDLLPRRRHHAALREGVPALPARDMQMVFQEPHDSLNPRYTAFDTVAEPLLLERRAAPQRCASA